MDWYKHDAKAFLEGTADMTNLEVGIYIRLLDHQFSRGGYLPRDFDRLAALVTQNDSDQAALRNVLAMKFRRHKRGYCNLRMLQTVRDAKKAVENKRLAARARWDADAMQVHNKRNATRARARRASDSLSMSVSQEGKEKGSGEKPLGVELPAGLGTPVFRATWAEWIGYRRQHGWSVKAPWAQRQLAMLAEHGPEVAAAALQQSMRQGWQGVFPEKIATSRPRHSPEDSDLTPTDYSYLDS